MGKNIGTKTLPAPDTGELVGFDALQPRVLPDESQSVGPADLPPAPVVVAEFDRAGSGTVDLEAMQEEFDRQSIARQYAPSPEPNPMVATMAAQFIAAQIIHAGGLASYIKRDNATPTGAADDNKLKVAITVAKRLFELSGS